MTSRRTRHCNDVSAVGRVLHSNCTLIVGQLQLGISKLLKRFVGKCSIQLSYGRVIDSRASAFRTLS